MRGATERILPARQGRGHRREADRLCALLKREPPLDYDAFVLVQTLDTIRLDCVNIYGVVMVN